MEESGYALGRRFVWSESNPCRKCFREMHKPKSPEAGKVKYHAKGLCAPCYGPKANGRSYIVYDDFGQTCTRCQDHLDYSHFSTNPRTRSGYMSWCTTCSKLYKHGMTKTQYLVLFEKQSGRCAICNLPPKDGGKALAVDHDHKCCSGPNSCGSCVRGLLCDNCNKGIGFLGDSIDTVLSAYNYLKERHIVQSIN